MHVCEMIKVVSLSRVRVHTQKRVSSILFLCLLLLKERRWQMVPSSFFSFFCRKTPWQLEKKVAICHMLSPFPSSFFLLSACRCCGRRKLLDRFLAAQNMLQQSYGTVDLRNISFTTLAKKTNNINCNKFYPKYKKFVCPFCWISLI